MRKSGVFVSVLGGFAFVLLLVWSFMGLFGNLIAIRAQETPDQTTPESSAPTPEVMHEPNLPYLLYSASDSPPQAGAVYDILYANNSKNEAQPPLSPVIPDGFSPVLDKDLSKDDIFELRNETAYRPDLPALLAGNWKGERPVMLKYSESEPLVLIYHTHTTEAYSSENAAYVDQNSHFRSENEAENIIAVGKRITNILKQEGIGVYHCKTVHDTENFSESYENARKSVLLAIERYPSIRYILDVHRDSIVTVSGEHIRPIINENGVKMAQIMLVVGTNEGGANHPNWQNNLAFALLLQSHFTIETPGLMRPINLRSSSFLGQYASGAVLLEVGSAANSLSEALAAAQAFAQGYAQVIRSIGI